MGISERRLNDSQLPRLNNRPPRYYLVQGRLEGDTLRQWIIVSYKQESDALAAAEEEFKAIVTDCRDWTAEELDHQSRALLVEDETSD
jgi:hypothetical protein